MLWRKAWLETRGRFITGLIVLSVIPLGVIGAVVALWITGNSLSFVAIIGLIALAGIEVKNSILLVDFTNQLRAQGKGLEAAIREAGEIRFLPIVLTSLTAESVTFENPAHDYPKMIRYTRMPDGSLQTTISAGGDVRAQSVVLKKQ